MRRTKIVATLGPSLDDQNVMRKVLESGANVFRANFSHGTADDHRQRIGAVRQLAEELGLEIAVMADLQGPKIRVARFKNDAIDLAVGDSFILDAELDSDGGDQTKVGIDYKALPKDVQSGDTLLLDDGRLVFVVTKVVSSEIHCEVVVGGRLSNNKGINRQGGGLSADALTEKDRKDLLTAVSLGVDYVAISFPRCAADIQLAKQLLQDAGSQAGVVAKIERTEAVDNIDEIIQESAAIMVARGDLGVEIGDSALPAVQKHLIQRARELDKAVITATQMMESMIHNSIPTRAEVFDVANAVLDGTDAVMLSAETATGDNPDLVVEAMNRICVGAEAHPQAQVSRHRVELSFERVDEAIAMATMYTANHLDIKAIIALTESGYTPRLMSRIRTAIPIYGLSRNQDTRRKMALFCGVYPVEFDPTQYPRDEINKQAIECLKQQGILSDGDNVIITKGDAVGVSSHTNAMKIYKV